ncbi:hypothetical protein [Neisseria wadsworthii]|uniref:DUF995 domain-containing protein n=1 Tax=Neisseria wadsworthii 9715 TaxID=1030841 RepID=G4CNU5_9NEIS|nr:hypothetical protein [Neisseria wadsworthii]EGZ48895.1 hypothetical protein HMPREF9370_0754 [Neisseria wadsworthii 9715]QMT36702.1 hypothetical protein H3L96_05755 [Neisseria wadsworthii]
MKKSCFAAVLLCAAVSAAAAEKISERKEMEILAWSNKKDVRLEQQIQRALAPLAKSRGWAVQRGTDINNDAGVYYSTKQDSAECDGAQVCTVMAVYYNTHPECRKVKMYGKTYFEKNPGGSGRDTYFTTHKNVCYQLSVVGRKNGEAVAKALKSGM